MTNNALSALLNGFEFVESDGVPFVTLDNQRRFYLNTTARKLLGVKPHDRVAIAYNAAEQSLAIVRPDAVKHDIHATVSQYFVDKRYYMSARKFAERYAYPPEQAPYEFVYDRGDSAGDVFIFRLRRE